MLAQRWLSGLAIVAAIVLAVAAYGRLGPRLTTDSDFALAELHTELASRGELTTGPYSRLGWNHPGPMLAYVQAAFYAAGGRNASTMFAVASVINVVSIALIAWCARRCGSPWLAVALTAACLVFAWRAPRVLASPWSGHIGVLPAMAGLVLAAAVTSGRARWLPLLLILGSFATQTHLSLVPMIGVIGLIASIAAWRADRRAIRPAVAAWTVLWFPPLMDAVLHEGGNLRALWRFFIADAGSGHSLAESFRAWSAGLSGVWRSGFALPWGGHLVVPETVWLPLLAIAQVVLVPIAAVASARHGRRFEAALAWCAWAASLAGLFAVTRIEGAFLDHEIFWLAPLGAINIAIMAAPVLARLAQPRAAVISAAALLLICGALAIAQLRDLAGFEMRRTTPRRIPLAHQAIRNYMAASGASRVFVDMQGDAWSEGAAIVLRLYQDGVAVTVPDTHLAMFTRQFRSRGWEDARITISSREGQHAAQQARPGNVTLLAADPVFVNAIRVAPGR